MSDRDISDDKDGRYGLDRVPGRFYVSRRFPQAGEDPSVARACRFAWQVFDERDEVISQSDDAWDLVIRETPTRQQLKVKFFEETREVEHLAFQRINRNGQILQREYFVLTGSEVASLSQFLSLVRSRELDLSENRDGIRLLPGGIDAALADESAQRAVFDRYRDVFARLFEADVQSPEIVALARRRQELKSFAALLDDPGAMEDAVRRLGSLGMACREEDVWQEYFEANTWIFGAGLGTQFLHAWDPSKLQQTSVGASMFQDGKRPDAVMLSAGALSALTFVEIKKATTDLLESRTYRSGVWAVGKDVLGGVAQLQHTVDETLRTAPRQARRVDAEGFEVGDPVYLCRPRAILVVGCLDQFRKDGEVNVGMFESFERFRRSVRDPEIVTFDELFHRARLILDLSREGAM